MSGHKQNMDLSFVNTDKKWKDFLIWKSTRNVSKNEQIYENMKAEIEIDMKRARKEVGKFYKLK